MNVRPMIRSGLAIVFLACAGPVQAHPVPFTFVDVRLQASEVEVAVVAHIFDIAHDLGIEPIEKVLEPEFLKTRGDAVAALLRSRLQISADGATLTSSAWSPPEPLRERQSIRFHGRYGAPHTVGTAGVRALMFPYDPQHKTFVNVYEDGVLGAQSILDKDRVSFEYFAGTRQGIWALAQKVVPAGMGHVLSRPDHVLLLIGLLLLGGSFRQLLIVVAAFGIAQSLTLSLASLRLVIPPVHAIGPALALSAVYVGADNLLVAGGGRDTRPWVAFAFGLIQGFGLANLLRQMDLPTRALGWTLFSFNIGVEIGQLLVVVFVASVLARIRARSEVAGRRLAFAGSITLMLAGTFWFVQRVFFSGGTA